MGEDVGDGVGGAVGREVGEEVGEAVGYAVPPSIVGCDVRGTGAGVGLPVEATQQPQETPKAAEPQYPELYQVAPPAVSQKDSSE